MLDLLAEEREENLDGGLGTYQDWRERNRLIIRDIELGIERLIMSSLWSSLCYKECFLICGGSIRFSSWTSGMGPI